MTFFHTKCHINSHETEKSDTVIKKDEGGLTSLTKGIIRPNKAPSQWI